MQRFRSSAYTERKKGRKERKEKEGKRCLLTCMIDELREIVKLY